MPELHLARDNNIPNERLISNVQVLSLPVEQQPGYTESKNKIRETAISLQDTIRNELFTSKFPVSEEKFTKEQQQEFYKLEKGISREFLSTYLKTLSSDQIASLNSGKGGAMIFRKLLKTLPNETIDQKKFSGIMKSVQYTIMPKEQPNPDTVEGKDTIRIALLYANLLGDLRKCSPPLTAERFFYKLFLHESAGNSKTGEIMVNVASGTGSLGPTQVTATAGYNNAVNINPNFNPLDPEQAIPGGVKHFLLEAYANVKGGTGITKIARALDMYNKGSGGTWIVPDSELMKPVTTNKDKYGNPYNYAYKVLSL